MGCEQFGDCDKSFLKDAMKSVNQPYGESVIIKRYTGVSDPGDPARGIQAKFQYTLIPTKAVISSIAQQDILYSNGIYQLGDIKASLTMRLNYVDTIVQQGGKSQGDHLLFKGHEYRVVGKVDDVVLLGVEQSYNYVFRQVGTA